MTKQVFVCKPNIYGTECCFHIVSFTDHGAAEDSETMTEMCCWCGLEKRSRHGKKLPETFRSMDAVKARFFPNEVRTTQDSGKGTQ